MTTTCMERASDGERCELEPAYWTLSNEPLCLGHALLHLEAHPLGLQRTVQDWQPEDRAGIDSACERMEEDRLELIRRAAASTNGSVEPERCGNCGEWCLGSPCSPGCEDELGQRAAHRASKAGLR